MNEKQVISNMMSQGGMDVVTDTVVRTIASPEMYVGITVLEPITIAAITTEVPLTGNTLTGWQIPAGTFPLRFTSIRLTGGKAFLHKGE